MLRMILAKLWGDGSDISPFEYAVLAACVVATIIFAG